MKRHKYLFIQARIERGTNKSFIFYLFFLKCQKPILSYETDTIPLHLDRNSQAQAQDQ